MSQEKPQQAIPIKVRMDGREGVVLQKPLTPAAMDLRNAVTGILSDPESRDAFLSAMGDAVIDMGDDEGGDFSISAPAKQTEQKSKGSGTAIIFGGPKTRGNDGR
jgi:hypothetical protein